MKKDFVVAKEELDIIGIVKISQDFYLKPEKRGSCYFVRSPVTHDKTASLALYPNTNRFCDFANGNLSGDCISFVAYVRGCNNWHALKALQTYYGLMDAKEQDREKVRRRIELQKHEEHRRKERKQAFYMALWGEIERLKRWAVIYSTAIEKAVFEPFSESFACCVGELQKVNYKLDILTAADMNTYRRMKYSDVLVSDRPQWLLDVLMILSECGAFQATEDEISEIKAQRDFELTREVGEQRRCKIDW